VRSAFGNLAVGLMNHETRRIPMSNNAFRFTASAQFQVPAFVAFVKDHDEKGTLIWTAVARRGPALDEVHGAACRAGTKARASREAIESLEKVEAALLARAKPKKKRGAFAKAS